MTQPQPHLHTIQAPPQNDQLNQAIVRILEVALTYEAAKAALATLLKPYRIFADAIGAVLTITGQGTNHRPRPRGYHGIARATADSELYLRAAYIARASRRIQEALDSGTSLRVAVTSERRYWSQHEQARRSRQLAVMRDVRNASYFGRILGWYLNPLLNNEPECIAANGHNYDYEAGTVIGRPGAVHSGCGCTSGPPHAGAGWVDDAVAPHVRYGSVKLLRPLRRKAG